jgi:aspartate-semialdehyde dehydrogenase
VEAPDGATVFVGRDEAIPPVTAAGEVGELQLLDMQYRHRVEFAAGHGVAVHAEFDEEISVDDARQILREAPGVELLDDPDTYSFPTPLNAAGNDPCYVGRIRQDHFDDKALEMFCVADNLRKGAALNTVQVAELLLH